MGESRKKYFWRRSALLFLLFGFSLTLLAFSGEARAQPTPCNQGAPGDCQVLGFPGCYICNSLDICVPDDSFCDDISGGKLTNECRDALCIPNVGQGQVDPNNPSGCDYDLDPANSTECRNCIPVGLATLENCGNGICEPDEGESCDTCAIDCNPAGYPGICLDEGDAQLNAICEAAGISFVTFSGPPYPTTGQLPGEECEDGDLCTSNVCITFGDCQVTDLGCLPDEDFCCPAGCAAPTGTSCREVTGAPIPGCDPDCYVPEQCIPTPSPTPIPTPPVFVGCLEGSGSLSGTGGAGCKGFACSLNTAASAAPGLGLMLSMVSLLGLGGYRALRKYRG